MSPELIVVGDPTVVPLAAAGEQVVAVTRHRVPSGRSDGAPVGDALLSLIRDREKQPVEFYVDWNRHEQRDSFYGMDLRKSSRQVAAALEEKGYAVLGGEAPGGGGWGSMRARTDRILEAFFPLRD